VISCQSFLKRVKSTGIPEEDKKEAYVQTIKMLTECHEKQPDRVKMREIEEKYQWPILSKLDDPASNFYENVEEESKKIFISLILDEKRLRLNTKSMTKEAYEKEIDAIIAKRMEYFAMMLNFTQQDIRDFKSNPVKFLGILAALAGATFFIFGKISKGKNRDKKENKKKEEKK
jgi:hypothetical protein